MKRIKIEIFCLLCILTVGLSGCSVHNVSRGQAEGEAYDAVISVKGKDETALEQLSEQLMALTELVGKDDEAAAELLGGGEENRTADGQFLIGRSYRTELFGQECSVYTSYDEAALVSVVVAELPGQDAESCRELLTALFGSETEVTEEETEEKSWYWENGGYRFTLYAFDDALSLDVNWADFQ